MAYMRKEKPTSILLKAIFEHGDGLCERSDAVIITEISRRCDDVAPLYSRPTVIDVAFNLVDVARQARGRAGFLQ